MVASHEPAAADHVPVGLHRDTYRVASRFPLRRVDTSENNLPFTPPTLLTMEALTSLWATLKAYQGPLLTLAIVFGPGLLRRTLLLFGPPPPDVPRSPRSWVLLGALLLQTIYTFYTLVHPPYDVFTSYNLLTPTDILRPLVLADLGLDPTPTAASDPLVDLFLTRLATVDGRAAYSRWGHAAFFTCAWCRAKSDYALAALPGIAGPYVAQAVLIGALGWQSVGGAGARERAKRWRPMAGWAVAAAAVAEFAARWWTEIRMQGSMLHVSGSVSSKTLLRTQANSSSRPSYSQPAPSPSSSSPPPTSSSPCAPRRPSSPPPASYAPSTRRTTRST